ncbi:MAG: tRNA (adenosine(37)-N6)-threonylcarbamoyltransferase complex ATPase subunit type 1 TsaE [Candidatus Dojkabacteria bacterium]|nr:MAG: tRNA (adenosine(37)-N6)-threonylcarbamoyltransferase complex ATPase subunit type 1 TsaE [Candidatus Dojkabacteria bacterium]
MTLEQIGELVLTYAKNNSPAIFTLSGELGAGKTFFVNHVAQKMGYQKKLPSPTFTFLQEYSLDWNDKTVLVHCDFYRIEEGKEDSVLEQIGFWDYLLPKNIIFIEWPERAQKLLQNLPLQAIHITLDLQTNERNYEIA